MQQKNPKVQQKKVEKRDEEFELADQSLERKPNKTPDKACHAVKKKLVKLARSKPSADMEALFRALYLQRYKREKSLKCDECISAKSKNSGECDECVSTSTTEDEEDFAVNPGGDALIPTVKSKYQQLQHDYKKEKYTREQAEKAFSNLVISYDEQTKKYMTAMESSRQAFRIAQQIKDQYEELRKITKMNEQKLDEADVRIELQQKMLLLEKQRGDKLQANLRAHKQPLIPDHTACNELLQQAEEEKQQACNEIGKMAIQIKELTKEVENLGEDKQDLFEKIADVMQIKSDLSQQNEIYLLQLQSMKKIISDKDKQIGELLARDPMQATAVRNQIECLKSTHETEKDVWRQKLDDLRDEINKFPAVKTELEKMVEQRQREMEATCKQHHLLKRNYEALKEKLNREIEARDKNVLKLVESTKCMKIELSQVRSKDERLEKEIAFLREQNRVKDIEISVLGDAKQLFEEQIKKYVFERDTVYQIAKQFEQQIESARSKLKELENCKHDLYQQLKEVQCKLAEERDSYRIQEKILEDNRDTVAMLKCKLRECNHKLYKSEREKAMLMSERDR